jgi:hypothetical protein
MDHIPQQDLLVAVENLESFGDGHAVNDAGRKSGLRIGGPREAHLVLGRDPLAGFEVTPTQNREMFSWSEGRRVYI